jgi:hypothetical protein
MVEEEGVAEHGFRCRVAFSVYRHPNLSSLSESYHLIWINYPGFSGLSMIF